jgi:cell wall-associated NlpC family hydrolase
VKPAIFSALLSVFGFCLHDGCAAQVHVVVPGEQVGRLAAIYAVSAEEIVAANPSIALPLEPGVSVLIPDSATAEAPPSAPPAATPIPIAAPVRTERSVAGVIQIPAAQGIRYNGRWVPPGETSAWAMDCSNTARWIVRETRGIELPRTASSQYEWLKKNKRLWRVRPNAAALRKRLKPGDLLFWEHTYRPVRKPPVTHVMVYLGTDAQGRMLMAGSQGSRGVDTYTFDPAAKMGSYPFFLWFRRDGRFVAYGRP